MTNVLELNPSCCPARSGVSLAQYTSLRVGGSAEWFATPRTTADLQSSLDWARAESLPITFLGAGSNLLVSDRGLSGLVICTRQFRQIQFDDGTGQVTAAAGDSLAGLAWKAARRGWRGLEWAVGIPGTVGGAVVMNAGAHGRCISDSLMDAHVLSTEGAYSILRNADLQYCYRSSVMQGSNRMVTQATFQLQPGHEPKQVMADTAADLQQRRATQPYDMPSCGSVFRNPNTHSAGRLIEAAGLKGFTIGRAQVSDRHANFILNQGGATAGDILRIIRHVQETVENRWCLLLNPEVKILGEFCSV
ncbi:MAG: UDP-N-acetylmuramate dehydrogenase [Cyanobacteria bacterium P01_H01_bin.119]